eukprot:4042369-Prymnesium_polylepis.1
MRDLDSLVKHKRKRLGSSRLPRHLTELKYQTFSLITPIPDAGRPPALMAAIPIVPPPAPPAYGAQPQAPLPAPPPTAPPPPPPVFLVR